MPSEYHGCSEEAITKLSQVSSLNRSAVTAVVYFLYVGAQILPVSDRMKVLDDKSASWGLTRTEETVRDTLSKLASTLRKVDWMSRSILEHESNSLEPYMLSTVRGAIDTVPCYGWGSEHSYQPKYAANVTKFAITVTNTGFVVQVSEGYCGSVHDQTILSAAGFASQWAPNDVWLCDGIFADSRNTVTPDGRPQLFPKHPKPGHNLHELLKRNEMHAHFRSRVEHTFSGVMFNRFRCFSRWQRSHTMLNDAVVVACGVLNYEALLAHGVQGRYKPISQYSEAEHKELADKFERHKNMSSRYPEEKKNKSKRARKEEQKL